MSFPPHPLIRTEPQTAMSRICMGDGLPFPRVPCVEYPAMRCIHGGRLALMHPSMHCHPCVNRQQTLCDDCSPTASPVPHAMPCHAARFTPCSSQWRLPPSALLPLLTLPPALSTSSSWPPLSVTPHPLRPMRRGGGMGRAASSIADCVGCQGSLTGTPGTLGW